MKDISMRKFTSSGEFFQTAVDMFRGPTFLGMLINVDGKFREKVILTVSFANNCGV